MTPDEIGEALERARYESLRGSVWTDLREGERTARVEVARRALEQAGVTALLADLTAKAERTADLEGLLAQRDAEIGRRIEEHEVELTTLRSERDAAVAALEAELARTRGELDEARALGAATDARAAAAESVLDAVRTALEPADGPDEALTREPQEPPTQGAPPAVTRMVPKSRFGRLARVERS